MSIKKGVHTFTATGILFSRKSWELTQSSSNPKDMFASQLRYCSKPLRLRLLEPVVFGIDVDSTRHIPRRLGRPLVIRPAVKSAVQSEDQLRQPSLHARKKCARPRFSRKVDVLPP
jgi:hypothetical protein